MFKIIHHPIVVALISTLLFGSDNPTTTTTPTTDRHHHHHHQQQHGYIRGRSSGGCSSVMIRKEVGIWTRRIMSSVLVRGVSTSVFYHWYVLHTIILSSFLSLLLTFHISLFSLSHTPHILHPLPSALSPTMYLTKEINYCRRCRVWSMQWRRRWRRRRNHQSWSQCGTGGGRSR